MMRQWQTVASIADRYCRHRRITPRRCLRGQGVIVGPTAAIFRGCRRFDEFDLPRSMGG